jgi:hypothetical protein
MNRPLGPRQRNLLAYLQRFPADQRHYLPPNQRERLVAESLQRRGLVHLTDCGMNSTTGQPVLIISLAEECQR